MPDWGITVRKPAARCLKETVEPAIRICYGRGISDGTAHSEMEDFMDDADSESILATAVERARSAYRALAKGSTLPPDAVLARTPEYRTLLMAGCQIRTLGNRALFLQTMRHLFTDDPHLSARAAGDLDHLWAGLADWPDNDRRARMN